MVRLLVDKYVRTKFSKHKLTEEQLVAEGDKSPGVLMASGYIAGGALAGIIFAFLNSLPALSGFNEKVGNWATTRNPFFHGGWENVLPLIPFLIITVLLYLAGRELILRGKDTAKTG
jgi:hypothetical protein